MIASRIGGIPEVVTDGESGFLSPVGDIEKMSQDALKLLNDEDMRLAFGRAGRESAVTRYSATEIIPLYIKFYEKVLGAKSAVA